MRDQKRIEVVLGVIEQIWKANPDLRLAQLIENATGGQNYYMEEEALLSALQRTYARDFSSVPEEPKQ